MKHRPNCSKHAACKDATIAVWRFAWMRWLLEELSCNSISSTSSSTSISSTCVAGSPCFAVFVVLDLVVAVVISSVVILFLIVVGTMLFHSVASVGQRCFRGGFENPPSPKQPDFRLNSPCVYGTRTPPSDGTGVRGPSKGIDPPKDKILCLLGCNCEF